VYACFASVGNQSSVSVASFVICYRKNESDCPIIAYSFPSLPFVSLKTIKQCIQAENVKNHI